MLKTNVAYLISPKASSGYIQLRGVKMTQKGILLPFPSWSGQITAKPLRDQISQWEHCFSFKFKCILFLDNLHAMFFLKTMPLLHINQGQNKWRAQGNISPICPGSWCADEKQQPVMMTGDRSKLPNLTFFHF